MKRQIIRALVIAGILLFIGTTATAGWAWHRGYRVYSVRTGSMEPAYHPGDAVLIGPASDALTVGDVITFRPPGSPTSVTHRVVSTAGTSVTTKGDANTSVDTWQLDRSMIEGEVIERLPSFGYALIYLQQPTGVASLMTFGLAVVMLWQIFFSSQRQPVPTTPKPRDRLTAWSELAESLEATTSSILAARAPDNVVVGVTIDEPPTPVDGACSPAIPTAWSEDIVSTIETLCAQLAR